MSSCLRIKSSDHSPISYELELTVLRRISFPRYFLWRFSVLCSTLNFLSESYTWPLLVYMLLICVYPFTSSCAHTFSTMSPEARHICYFFDYGALSLYSLGKARCMKSDCLHFTVRLLVFPLPLVIFFWLLFLQYQVCLLSQ